MVSNNTILAKAEELAPYVVDCRRIIHEFAEVSGKEVKTSAFIKAELEKLGLPVEHVAETALIAHLDTGRPGKHILLRADMDALPVPQSQDNLAGPRCCYSKNPGNFHACGHDAHSAMLLGSVKALHALKDQLCGTLHFVFEQGEEDGSSVERILKALANHPIDTVWAIHVYAELESGKISVDAGPRMAGAAGMDVTLHGRGGHGSRPDLSINPVFAAASILPNLAVAFENQINVEETVTLGVTSIQGGSVGNVIPDSARVLGSLRFFNQDEGVKAFNVMKKVCELTAEMNNCTVEYGPLNDILCQPVINDEAYATLAASALSSILPEGSVAGCPKWYASESMNQYLTKYPGVFAFLGTKNPAYGSGAPHHNERFDVDENILPMGLISTIKYVCAVLEQA